MAVYVNDAIWRRLSDYYGVTADQAQVGDLYKRWLDENGLSWQNAGDFFMSQFPGVVNRADAEWLFWTYGLGDDLVLLLDAAQESQSGVAAQVVKNRGDRRVGDAQLGSSSGVDSNDPVWLPHDGTSYVYLPGVTNNFMSVPSAIGSTTDLTGDLAIAVHIANRATVDGLFLLKRESGVDATLTAFNFSQFNNPGLVYRFNWTESGGTARDVISTVAIPANREHHAVTHDVDNGAGGNTLSFYSSADGITWNLEGSVTNAYTTNHRSSAAQIGIGGTNAGAAGISGGYRRVRMWAAASLAGSPVLDVDTSVIASGAATSFTATTGQTVTISRSTSGKKSVAVTRPCWLFGTNSYMEVADNDLLDFGASDSFTVMAVVRQWATPGNNRVYVGKLVNGPTDYDGWQLTSDFTNLRGAIKVLEVGSGDEAAAVGPSAYTAGSLQTLTGVINRTTNRLQLFQNGTGGTDVNMASVGDISTSVPLRVGASSSGIIQYQDFELMAVAVVRRALTETEIGYVNQYFTITPSLPTPTPEPVPWAPTSMTGLELWLDAADTSTITSSSLKVSEWRDKSGKNRHVTQGTAAAQPTSNVSTQNGLNVVEFDGGDSLVSVSPASVWKFLHDGTNYMVGVVTARDIAGVNGTIIATKNAAASIGVHIHFGASNILRHNVQDGANAVVSNEPAIGTSTAARLFTILADPDNATAADRSTIFLEDDSGSKLNLQVLSPSASDPAATLAVGDRPTSPVPLNGFICELVIVSGADANETNRVLLRDYLSTKWGV